MIGVEYGISRDGGSKASYEQRSNETHLGVRETDLATVNTFASIKGGDMGYGIERILEAGWMNIGFSVFLTNLVSMQQDSCTRRIFACS